MVEKTRLAEFNEELAGMNFQGQWTVEGNIGGPALEPCLWKWNDVHDALERSREVFSLDEMPQGTRRNVGLNNPIFADDMGKNWSSWTIKASIQMVVPGEIAKAHRHSITAIRFIIQGQESAYTTVNGEAFPMYDGDLVLTPRGTWHDHENNADAPVIWLDGLDVSLLQSLKALDIENHAAGQQPKDKDEGYFNRRYNVLQSERASGDGDAATPPYRYAWENVRAMLYAAEDEIDPDPFDGYVYYYANPATNAPPTLSTISCRIQKLAGGQETASHKHTTTEIFHVVDGSGATEIDGETIRWTENDSFIVPPGSWHSHENRSSDDDAILFTMSDRPVFESMDLYQEESETGFERRDWIFEE